jgi:non-homologous end joining protein Ku
VIAKLESRASGNVINLADALQASLKGNRKAASPVKSAKKITGPKPAPKRLVRP